jgi:hypothetical protein
VGVVLMQDGRPTAFHSQALGQKAPAHSIYHKEALAILQALKKWRHYILGNHLIIRTDQQILKFMMTQWLTEGIQHKLLMKLLEFNHSIEYKKKEQKTELLMPYPDKTTMSHLFLLSFLLGLLT